VPEANIAQDLLLPDLRFRRLTRVGFQWLRIDAVKESPLEVCPRCATPSSSTYDHRTVRIKDEPVRGQRVDVWIRKRRLSCRPCGRPFTEPVGGIRKGARCTERYRKSILHAAETYSCLSDVRRDFRCSSAFLYKTLFSELERRRRTRLYPWPAALGIDEHFFRRERGIPRFASMVVDYRNRRVMELCDGRTVAELEAQLDQIPGRDNVRHVVMDLCEPFRTFTKGFFPNARIIADKFHVLRLLHPAINRHRKQITGDKRTLPIRRLLLRSGHTLDWATRTALDAWLAPHPELAEIYRCKEAMHRLYRTKGSRRAAEGLTWITDQLAASKVPELRRLRRTLLSWRTEILRYFDCPLTNGRTEGFNNKAKLVKKRAYGYRNFENYRLRLLNACA
jgi:transposase